MAPIKFGTDGWRGIIAQDFTFDNVRACAQGVASYLLNSGLAHNGLIIGYDTRFASEDFAAAVAEVTAGNNIKAYLCPKPSPTPVISYGIVVKKAAGAVIITASHNPALWNGFKYKPWFAGSAPPEITDEIERRIPSSMAAVKHIPFNNGLQQGLIECFDPSPIYLQHIAELINLEKLKQAGVKVVVDSMYGAGAGYFKSILSGGSTEVFEINGERNPSFPGIQPEPIAKNLTKLSTLVRERGADVGLATDGDADRIGIIDENGSFLTPLQTFALLALYLLEVRGERGTIVKTITSTSMLYRLGELFSVPVYETPVGFKHVCPKMLEGNALIGGEESGGFGFRGHIPERDAFVAGLYFLDLMLKLRKKPSELVNYLYSKVGPHYYDRIDLHFPAEERADIGERIKINKPSELGGIKVAQFDTMDGFRFKLEDKSWLLIRFSGTEPILRIYAEASSPQRVEELLNRGRELVGVHG
jgi:phosphomannomutase